MFSWLWMHSAVYRLMVAALEREQADHARTRSERDEFKRLWIEAVDGRLQNRPSVSTPPARQEPISEPVKMRRSRAEIQQDFQRQAAITWERERREMELAAHLAGEVVGQPNDVEGPVQ